jgi:ribosomal protein S18 acetylase RimI-like enzyme
VSSPTGPEGEVVLQLARVADAGVIATMSRALIETGLRWSWTPQRVTREIRDRNANVLVARAAGVVAGFAIMRYGETHAHLNLLAVDTRFRRQGIGRRMMQWLEQTALVAGIADIGLEVRAQNVQARRFYAALGYGETRQLPNYYGGVEAAVAMRRRLRDAAPPPSMSFPLWRAAG